MKIAIIGFQGSGKSTFFKALTTADKECSKFDPSKPCLGKVEVKDPRLQNLASIFKSEKITFEEIVFMDLPGFNLASIKDVEAVSHVVGVFSGRDYIKDIEKMELEFMLSDLGIIEKRLTGLEKEIKSHASAEKEKEKKILTHYKKTLEEDTPLRERKLNQDEERIIAGYQFLSKKPIFIIVNLEENQLSSKLASDIEEFAKKIDLRCVSLCAKIEAEIQDLEPEDRQEFMKGLGLKEPALKKVIETARGVLDIIAFFTVKGKEAKAWPIKSGTKAIEAAGKIHTDIQRGFIKAEIINYEDFVECGSFAEAKNRGLLRLEGKEYMVKDGDIIDFKFNV